MQGMISSSGMISGQSCMTAKTNEMIAVIQGCSGGKILKLCWKQCFTQWSLNTITRLEGLCLRVGLVF